MTEELKDTGNAINAIIYPSDSEQKTERLYYISSYGRFGYMVNFFLGLFFSWGICVPLWSIAHEYSFGAKLFIFFLGVGSWYLMIYACTQFFRKTPRFALDDNGFSYSGLLLRRYVSWSDIESLRVSSRGGFVFLTVRLREVSFLSRNIKLDVSGMSPNYSKLYNEMIKHISSTAKKASWF